MDTNYVRNALELHNRHGRKGPLVVQENPHRLAANIFGIGFITADKIAHKPGIARDLEVRAEAGVLYDFFPVC